MAPTNYLRLLLVRLKLLLLLLLREATVYLLVAQGLAGEPLVLDYLTRFQNLAYHLCSDVDNLLRSFDILYGQILYL